MSVVPPCRPALSAIASTTSRDSREMFNATSLDVFGGIGRVVNVRQRSCVNSMTLMVSPQIIIAAVGSENFGLGPKPIAT